MHRATAWIARLWNSGCLGKLAIVFAGLVVLGCVGAALGGRPAVAPPVSSPTPAPAIQPTAEPSVVPTVAPTAAPATTAAPAAHPEGVAPASATDCPLEYPVKGNVRSDGQRIYHVPGSPAYRQTKPEQCFATAADAEAAGFRAPTR